MLAAGISGMGVEGKRAACVWRRCVVIDLTATREVRKRANKGRYAAVRAVISVRMKAEKVVRVAMTGYEGTGCSAVPGAMTSDFSGWRDRSVRSSGTHAI